MTDELRADAPPDLPPEPHASLPLRWALVVFALVALGLLGYKTYQWVSQADPVTADEPAAPEPPAAHAPREPQPAAPTEPVPAPAPVGRTVRPPQPSVPATSGEPAAPAVTGGADINKCIVGGQVTYTNGPCPEGTQVGAVPPVGVDPNGVPGSTGDRAYVTAARPLGLPGDPSQQDAECRYLAAEIARLDYEFKQPLPPPVLDQIATRLAQYRSSASSAKCPAVKEPAAPAAAQDAPRKRPAPAKKPVVVEERAEPADEKAPN